MSSRPGTVISRPWTSSSSRVGVPKVSAFRFVSRAVCSPYSTLNLRRPSFSSRCRSDLEQSSAARHIRAVTSRLLHSPEDTSSNCVIHKTFVVPAKWHCHSGHVNRFTLLTYLLSDSTRRLAGVGHSLRHIPQDILLGQFSFGLRYCPIPAALLIAPELSYFLLVDGGELSGENVPRNVSREYPDPRYVESTRDG